MNDDSPPLIAIPHDLDDAAVAKLLEFLYDLAQLLEHAYAGQLHRYYNRPEGRQAELWDDQDPPF